MIGGRCYHMNVNAMWYAHIHLESFVGHFVKDLVLILIYYAIIAFTSPVTGITAFVSSSHLEQTAIV